MWRHIVKFMVSGNKKTRSTTIESLLMIMVFLGTILALQTSHPTPSVAVMPAPAAAPVFSCAPFGGGSGPCPGCDTDVNNVPCNGGGIVDAATASFRDADGCITEAQAIPALRAAAAALNAGCGGNWGLSVKGGGTRCTDAGGSYACDVVCHVDAASCAPSGQSLIDVFRGTAACTMVAGRQRWGVAQWLELPCRCFCIDPDPPVNGGSRPCEPV